MFETYSARQASAHRAANVLDVIRQLYKTGKSTQVIVAEYIAGTNTALVGTVNAIFSPEERTDIANMLTDLNTLLAHLEADHRAALGLP